MAIETIYVAIQTFVYSLLLYSMIGFEWTGDKFFYFYYFIFMCFTYFSMYGMMVVALTPGAQIAAIVMSFFLSFWNLFSGFLIPRPVRTINLKYCFFGPIPIVEIFEFHHMTIHNNISPYQNSRNGQTFHQTRMMLGQTCLIRNGVWCVEAC